MLKKLVKRKEFNIFAIIIAVALLITIINVVTVGNPTFITPSNLIYLVKNNLVMWILSLGMLLVIISGGIDVSIPANITTGTIVIGYIMTGTNLAQTLPAGVNFIIILLAACLSCTLIGALNGLIISKLQIPPIITTLAMQSIMNGFILWQTNGNWITNLPEWFKNFGRISFFSIPDPSGQNVGIPIQFLFLIVAIVLTSFVLRYTLVGRGVYAIGGNRISAERVGYRPDRITVFIYAYIGFLAGIAAVAHTSIVEQVDPNAFTGIDMMVIAAAVIGGASVLGGTGTVFGTVLGSILVAVLNNGMVLVKIPALWHKAVLGIVIIVALSIDVIQRKRELAKQVKVDVE